MRMFQVNVKAPQILVIESGLESSLESGLISTD